MNTPWLNTTAFSHPNKIPTAKYPLKSKPKEKIELEKLKLLYQSTEPQVEGKENTEGSVHQLHESNDDEINNENNNINGSKGNEAR